MQLGSFLGYAVLGGLALSGVGFAQTGVQAQVAR